MKTTEIQSNRTDHVLYEDEAVEVIHAPAATTDRPSIEPSDVFHGEEEFEGVTVEEEEVDNSVQEVVHDIVHDDGHNFKIEDNVVVVDLDNSVNDAQSMEAPEVFHEFEEEDSADQTNVEDTQVKVDIITPAEAKLNKKLFQGEETVVVVETTETTREEQTMAGPVDEEDFHAGSSCNIRIWMTTEKHSA